MVETLVLTLLEARGTIRVAAAGRTDDDDDDSCVAVVPVVCVLRDAKDEEDGSA